MLLYTNLDQLDFDILEKIKILADKDLTDKKNRFYQKNLVSLWK